jgi:hypothetical protein
VQSARTSNGPFSKRVVEDVPSHGRFVAVRLRYLLEILFPFFLAPFRIKNVKREKVVASGVHLLEFRTSFE